MKLYHYLLICFFVIVALSACTGKSESANSIVNSPCQIPCWQNITPGGTKSEDINTLLINVHEIDKNKIERLPKWNIYDERYKFEFKDGRAGGQIYIVDSFVYSIVINGDLNITLEQIIRLYGEPEKLIVTSAMIPGFVGLEANALEINLIYLKNGFAFSFYNTNLDLISIKPNQLIKKAIFSEPKNIVNIISPNWQNLKELEDQERAFDWNGYQEIKYSPKR